MVKGLKVKKVQICFKKGSNLKGSVNPATLSEPEFFVFFTILNVNVYSTITNMYKSFTLGKLFEYNLLN